MSLPWGVGYTGDVFLERPGRRPDGALHARPAATLGDVRRNPTNGEWGGDMAFDAAPRPHLAGQRRRRQRLYGIDPSRRLRRPGITGRPWGVSQRGVAYDRGRRVLRRRLERGHRLPRRRPVVADTGRDAQPCNPADPNISGLAWNGSFGMLWEATNSDTDAIFLIDPTTCETVRAIDHPRRRRLRRRRHRARRRRQHLDGRPEQRATPTSIESGLPTFSDVPWLIGRTRPSGTVAKDGSAPASTITVDSTGLDARRVPTRSSSIQTERSRQRRSCRSRSTLVVPALPAGRQRRRQCLRRPDHRRPVRRPTGRSRPAASATSAGTTRIDAVARSPAPTATRSTRISGGHVGLPVRRPERRVPGRPVVRGAPAQEGRRHASSASRWRAPRSSRTSTCSPPPAASASPRPVVHRRGHRRRPRHRVPRPARRQADRQRDPRDGAAAGQPRRNRSIADQRRPGLRPGLLRCAGAARPRVSAAGQPPVTTSTAGHPVGLVARQVADVRAACPASANVIVVRIVRPASIETSVGRALWYGSVPVRWRSWRAASPTIHSWSIGSVFVITNVIGRPAGTRISAGLVVRVVDRDRRRRAAPARGPRLRRRPPPRARPRGPARARRSRDPMPSAATRPYARVSPPGR